MKTSAPFKQNLLKFVLFVSVTASGLLTRAQSGNSGGLKFDNPVLQSGIDLQAGAVYLFSNVDNNVDAVVKIDSLINGAKINKIDDNNNGSGYKDAFQPAIQNGGIIGMSYAVFSFKFYVNGTTNPVSLATINATAVDLDGNNTVKEFARIKLGNGSTMSYMNATPDISVAQIQTGDFMGQNILGIERSGIDTLAVSNMFTVTNTNISAFSVKYGAITSNASNANRQYSLYMKGFNYPNTLPVKLASFTAILNNNKVDMKWTTASEINVSHFVVEKSTDGANFSDAGIVFANGNATDKTNYSFSDHLINVQSGIVYYRLRSVDNDGKGQYSETRIIRISKQADHNITIVAYPNPVTNELRVTIPSSWQNKKVTYELFNANGQTSGKTESASSNQTETLNVSNLATGFYIMKVSCNGETAQQKIIKK